MSKVVEGDPKGLIVTVGSDQEGKGFIQIQFQNLLILDTAVAEEGLYLLLTEKYIQSCYSC